MSRTFVYARVSTEDQATSNQRIEAEARGYKVPDNRFISEVVSGGVAAMARPEFVSLVNHKLETGDTLVVTKIDRLGRDNIDVQTTIKSLMAQGIKVVSLDLPSHDLSSAEGQLVLQMFTAFAEFEKSRIAERTQAGLERAKAEGKKLGRPEAVETTKKVQELKAGGFSQSKVAERLGVTVITVKRHWNKIV
ncbi:recombinase family protein [Aeromonas encheleia]|uniref:Recombinase family protein n=1 Tax=Aeromonas encheleia TaxID=73010 RepID=A0AAE9SD65_9GAMM|nr:recombinase family protein [Aeromonas encheleia]USV56124.1 recombinase family protein [Aeromonas encheleia]